MRSTGMFWGILAVIVVVVGLLMFNHDAGSTLGIPNEGFATFAWAGIIGTVIAAGLVSRAGPSNDLLRIAAIWLAIFVALVVGYRLWHGESVFPGNQPTIPETGEGVAV